MPRSQQYQTEAIIIKKTKLGEADRILTLLTPHLGKIQAVAKGVRQPKSKMAGHLELLTHSQVQLTKGRNLDTISGCQTIHSFLPLKNDLDLTACGLYITELTSQFTTEDQEQYDIFTLLLTTLERLCETTNRDIVLRHFELQLLTAAGYRPQLQRCVSCNKPLEPVTNYFSFSNGGVLCPVCGNRQSFVYPISVNALKILRLLQNDDFALVSKVNINTRLAKELEDVLRRYVKYLLERDVKSTTWLDSLKS
jgi:DNA repair protein RecO (recombination protein O)